MQRKFIYLINPISGTGTKGRLLNIISEKTKSHQIPFEIVQTNAAGEYGFLRDKILSEKVTDVIVCGGDGTVNQVAGALLGVNVNVGIVPMGSGNGLAFAAGIPRNAAKALDVVIKGNAQLIDSFYINDKFSCMLCGLGFDAQVAKDFAMQGKRGLANYIKQATRNFFKAKPYPFQVEIGSEVLDLEAFFISIANSNQFGNHFTIAPKASLHDGLLDIVIVRKMSKMRMVWSVLIQITNGQVNIHKDRKHHRRKVLYFQATELSIQNPQLAPLHIDGDPAETAPHFQVRIIEKAISLLMP